MKYIPLLLTALCLVACNPEKKAIKEVAYNYCIATSYYQIDEAEQYATKETIEKTFPMARFFISQVDSSYIAADSPVDITIKKINQTSDTTAYVVYHKETPLKDFTDTLQMRFRDGHWLVHAPVRTHTSNKTSKEENTKEPSPDTPEK